MSIFPFISPELLSESTGRELPIFQEYAYDFENNRLLLRNGTTYLVQGNEALKIWICKTLLTERFRYLAYDADYGSELDTLRGSTLNNKVVQSELQRMIVEALMCNPYIEQLGGFEFSMKDSSLKVIFDCTTIYGTMSITAGGVTS